MSKEKQIEEMAFDLENHTCMSQFQAEIASRMLYILGYRKQSEGKWEIVVGSNGRERMVCTNCRHQQDLASTFTYCPNCGARMKGV
jgi:hypothetical protein